MHATHLPRGLEELQEDGGELVRVLNRRLPGPSGELVAERLPPAEGRERVKALSWREKGSGSTTERQCPEAGCKVKAPSSRKEGGGNTTERQCPPHSFCIRVENPTIVRACGSTSICANTTPGPGGVSLLLLQQVTPPGSRTVHMSLHRHLTTASGPI